MACLRIAERSGDSAGSPLSKTEPTPKPSPIPPGMPCIRMAAPTSYLGTSCPPSAPSVAPCSSREYQAHDLPVIDEKNVTLCCEGTDSSVLSCNRNGKWQPLHSMFRNVSGHYIRIRDLPHLKNWNVWNGAAKAMIRVLCHLLRMHNQNFPSCRFCGPNCNIEQHIRSRRHYNHLWQLVELAQETERKTGRFQMDNPDWYQDF